MDFREVVEKQINKKLRNSQLLLVASIMIAFSVALFGALTNQNYYLWAMYFVIIGALTLPNINKCKKDLVDYKQNKIAVTEGKVVDIFPEKEDEGNWILFLDVEGQKNISEFLFPQKPSIEPNQTIKLVHTSVLNIPIQIEIVTK